MDIPPIVQRIGNRLNRMLRRTKGLIGMLFYKLFFLEYPIEEKLRMSALDVAIAFVVNNQVEGDYLEFGVYRGTSFIRAYKKFKDHIERHKEYHLPRFIAFDSFEGLPESNEDHIPRQYHKGAYAFPQDEFVDSVISKGVDPTYLIVVSGFYNESLSDKVKQEHKILQASVIYIDCDIYESAVPVFHFITNLVQTGTIIVVDDWFRHRGQKTHGIQRACDEWLQENPHITLATLHVWERIAFIVTRKDQ